MLRHLTSNVFMVIAVELSLLHSISKLSLLHRQISQAHTLSQTLSSLQVSDPLKFKETYFECPGIRKSVCKEIDNMDMFEAEFGGVVLTGAEGWSVQHGETSLDSRVGGDDGGDEADSQPAAQAHSRSSRRKRKRKEKNMVVEACVKRTEALEVKNKIAERMLERQEASSVENVLEILYALPEVREWSPLYEAALELLIDSEGNRRAFITMKTDEAKIRFLELRTKIKRDD
ncbi:unnamed protein product [Brassica rapa]|uniref:Uncharacterized protein n=1 Tax=Brassica campestris TaxID=3711 RepID=A0A8D9FYD2_BRACM|nr:unnamed protein product [Brassica rapa]